MVLIRCSDGAYKAAVCPSLDILSLVPSVKRPGLTFLATMKYAWPTDYHHPNGASLHFTTIYMSVGQYVNLNLNCPVPRSVLHTRYRPG